MSNETEAKERAVERYRPSMHVDTLHAWAKDAQELIDHLQVRAAAPLPVEAIRFSIQLIESRVNNCEWKDTKAKFNEYIGELRALLEAK